MPTITTVIALVVELLVLGSLTLFWANKVQQIVPDPYLDEVFHIRQAQAYLKGLWHIWDPKITTPCGLYLSSWIQEQTLEVLRFSTDKSTFALRSINIYFGGGLMLLLTHYLLQLNTAAVQERKGYISDVSVWRVGHNAVNICLFPPLFFFYGLYYTDVLSAFSVLVTYLFYMRNQQNWLAVAGLISLLFRQTNVFWVAVFLGGLELCRSVPAGRPDIEFPRRATFHDVIAGSWYHSCVYDPLITEASIQDYIKTGISLVIAALRNPVEVFWSLSSCIVILCGFVEFVVWNGGVVLGDKANHVASIHFAQMLYIWPYFIFFSLPVVAPYALGALIGHGAPLTLSSKLSTRKYVPRIAIIILTLLGMLAIVHYNTIVHPFLLADNRHYMFYIFRILLRHPLIKYLAVPIYLISAWTCLIALGLPANTLQIRRPSTALVPKTGLSNRVSFLLVWLITTTLSLSTAPLVEPRYLILPWLTWRMHISASTCSAVPEGQVSRPIFRAWGGQQDEIRLPKQPPQIFNSNPNLEWVKWALDHALWLETLWFLAINATTGYMFLYRGFSWPQEPGQVQRFMW